MLTTIVVVVLFVVAFCMVVYEWAITLLWGLVAATIVTWIVTVYIEHVMKDLKMYERAYNLFILLRLLTIVLVVALAGIWFLSRLFFWKKTMRGSVKTSFYREKIAKGIDKLKKVVYNNSSERIKVIVLIFYHLFFAKNT